MKIGAPSFRRRFILLVAVGIVAVVLTACTGRGGGQLPPDDVFTGPASFGFTFSCEDKGGINSPTGKMALQLSYTDHGSNPIGSSFSIHGIVDKFDPVLESAVCIGRDPPPGGNELIFLGRYYLTSSAPSEFPSSACPTRETSTTPLCRFEVTVRDNDMNRAPSKGDFFKIMLSSAAGAPCNLYPPTDPACSELPAATVFYTRGGTLSSGNLTVD